MAGTSVITGRFINAVFKEWDAFTDRNGETVSAGQSCTVNVYTPHDNDLCVLVVNKKNQSALDVLGMVGELKFGDEITVDCGQLSFGKYKGVYGVQLVKAPASSSTK